MTNAKNNLLSHRYSRDSKLYNLHRHRYSRGSKLDDLHRQEYHRDSKLDDLYRREYYRDSKLDDLHHQEYLRGSKLDNLYRREYYRDNKLFISPFNLSNSNYNSLQNKGRRLLPIDQKQEASYLTPLFISEQTNWFDKPIHCFLLS